MHVAKRVLYATLLVPAVMYLTLLCTVHPDCAAFAQVVWHQRCSLALLMDMHQQLQTLHCVWSCYQLKLFNLVR